MTEEKWKKSIFKSVELHCEFNNSNHHTSEVTVKELIVRRGQAFTLTVLLSQPFKPNRHSLTIKALTGPEPSDLHAGPEPSNLDTGPEPSDLNAGPEPSDLHAGPEPSEDLRTTFVFGIPPQESPSSKSTWNVKLKKKSIPKEGELCLKITPPADAPIGEYKLKASYRDEEMVLATLVVLFNPWCPGDTVFLLDEKERQEYVMNEQGIIYKGSGNYIKPMDWNFGQFEPDMAKICMKILDMNHLHSEDPMKDVSSRGDPIYVGRVVSAMINSEGDHGVLLGRWGGQYIGGFAPSHWSGSHDILKRWFNIGCNPVKYGQCWVFAGVMCSVMRLLGIPCRVVTNYNSAHDTNKNLCIDTYHADYGVTTKNSRDSVWNYHVWVEGWMKRPDLAPEGNYDGWQVFDPTPQEMSDGVYCCGPAPVKAILNGDVHLEYDVPFVFAEVNADCIDWLVKADGTKVKIFSDITRVGQNISTKSVDSNKRRNITCCYKHREGSKKERKIYRHALTRDFTREEDWVELEKEKEEEEEEEEEEDAEMEETGEENSNATVDSESTEGGGAVEVAPEVPAPPPPVFIRFEEVSTPVSGKDIYLKLVLNSKSTEVRQLSIMLSVQVMNYNGSPVVNIMKEQKEETLLPGQDLALPVLIPFSTYGQHMKDGDNIKFSVVVEDMAHPENFYLAEDDVVLQEPPLSVTAVSTEILLNQRAEAVVIFKNPLKEELRDCILSVSGTGLLWNEVVHQLPNLPPNNRFRCTIKFIPYRIGQKNLSVNFDCSAFRDIKSSINFIITP